MTHGWKLGMVLIVSALGCSAEPPTGAEPSETLSQSGPIKTTAQSLLPDDRKYCSGVRWLAFDEDGVGCGPSGGIFEVKSKNKDEVLGTWTVSSVFSGHESVRLQKYCQYIWTPGTLAIPSDAVETALYDGVKLYDPGDENDTDILANTLAPDCEVVSPMAPQLTVMEKRGKTTNYAHYRDQINAMSDLPTGAEDLAQVRVAVIDNQPTTAFEPADRLWRPGTPTNTLGHGQAVGRLIRDLSCPGGGFPGSPSNGSCAGQIDNHLALRITNEAGDTDDINGGQYGSLHGIANAIVSAVDRPMSTDMNLVINLSLGWLADPQEEVGNRVGSGRRSYSPGESSKVGGIYSFTKFLANGDPDDFGLGMRLVYDAIYYANCKGAIVIASAGNVSGADNSDSGALFPAAFEAFKYHKAVCNTNGVGDGAPNDASGAGYHPLVYAVTGLTGLDRPSTVNRPHARPMLAAPADHFTTYLYEGETSADQECLDDQDMDGDDICDTNCEDDCVKSTKTFSGTSISAAAVSGIAATVWGYNPGLTPEEVMGLVYTSGRQLSIRAFFCEELNSQGVCGWVHRVSLCHAVKKVCTDKQTNRCPDPATINCGSLDPAGLTPLFVTEPPVGPGILQSTNHPDSLVSDPNADSPMETVRTTLSIPSSGPQPNFPICPSCLSEELGIEYKVLLQTEKDYDGMTLSMTTVHLDGLGSYPAGVDGIADGSLIQKLWVDKVSGVTVSSGTFSAKVTDPVTGVAVARESALLIIPLP